jgi:hypothetical protein
MKNELIKFIQSELGYEHETVNKAIKKYFKGKEVEWQKTRTMYVHETHSLNCENGELSLYGEFGEIIFNCETLFTDLPYIVKLVYKARKETDKRIKEDIEIITRLVTI